MLFRTAHAALAFLAVFNVPSSLASPVLTLVLAQLSFASAPSNPRDYELDIQVTQIPGVRFDRAHLVYEKENGARGVGCGWPRKKQCSCMATADGGIRMVGKSWAKDEGLPYAPTGLAFTCEFHVSSSTDSVTKCRISVDFPLVGGKSVYCGCTDTGYEWSGCSLGDGLGPSFDGNFVLAPSSPSPSPPSPAPPPSMETVVLTLTASGSVSDYTENDKSSLQQKVANAAGVDKSLVTIRVIAASVRITATIAVPASTTADVLRTSLSSSLGTAVAASTALGVTVEEVPTITVESGMSDSSSDDLNVALIVGIAVAGALAVGLLSAGVCVMVHRQQQRNRLAGGPATRKSDSPNTV